jgi:AAA15 family ATPase/GTPase
MFHSRKKLLVSLAALLVLTSTLVCGYFIQKDSDRNDVQGEFTTNQEVTAGESISINISFSDTESIELESNYEKKVTVFELLKTLDEKREDFSFTYTEYEGLGASPEKFNDYEIDPASEWWKFLVNGQMSNVGISSYEVKPGDKVEFVKEKF